nr:ATP synthase subunit 8 [Piezogaster calcarator]
MPQMAPLWWEILFILFITSFLMTNIMIYYLKSPEMLSIKSTLYKTPIQLNWKW